MSHKPWKPTSSPKEKTYTSPELRRPFHSDVSYTGDTRRHIFDIELASAAAGYTTGPRYSQASLDRIGDVLRSKDNVHYYGTKSANVKDRYAADAVLRSAFTGERVTVGSHHASHIRGGAEFIAAHKADLPPGFVDSVARMYVGVVGADGKKVVDGRMFNKGRPPVRGK